MYRYKFFKARLAAAQIPFFFLSGFAATTSSSFSVITCTTVLGFATGDVFKAIKASFLGVSIIGANAGELILPWSLAIDKNLKIRALADAIVSYPTLSEINKRVAGSFYTPLLFSSRTQKLVRFLMKTFS